jgi:hypothetical protein
MTRHAVALWLPESRETTNLSRRLRKLIGAILLALFVPAYAMTAMVVASAKLPGAPILVQTVSYALLGLFWVLPAGFIVAWMQRPERRSTRSAIGLD